MIALSEHLRNHGYDPKIESHTRIPGIWEKLGTLYNLGVIDERENSFDYADADTIEKKYLEFSLAEEDFGDMMWTKGMVAPSNADSSPSRLNEASQLPEPSKKRKRADTVITSRARASTIEDTDEPKSSPAPSSAAKPGRLPKGGKRSSSRLKGESSDRYASKDTTVDDMDEKADEKAEEKAEEKTEVLDADEEEHEEAGADDGSPSPRTSRSAVKAAKGGTQNRTQSATRKSTRRK
jgi:MRG-binding protein